MEEQKIRPVSSILLVLSLLIFCIPSFAQEDSTEPIQEDPQEQEEEPMFDRMASLLETNEILTSKDRAQLYELIKGLDPTKESIEDLQKLHAQIIDKIEKDKRQFQILLLSLNELRHNGYTRRVGIIKEHELEILWDRYNALEEVLEELETLYRAQKEPLKAEDYKESIQGFFQLLSKEGPATVSIAGFWDLTKKIVKPLYSSWNKRYQELQREEREATTPQREKVALTFEEIGFMKSFSHVQTVLRQLVEADSKDF